MLLRLPGASENLCCCMTDRFKNVLVKYHETWHILQQCQPCLKMFYRHTILRLSIMAVNCALLLLLMTRSALGQTQYVVKGTVTDRFYNPPSQDEQEVRRYRFEVFVRGEQWRIDLYQMDVTNNIVRRTVGSDNGMEIVHLAVNNRGPSFVLVEPQPFPVGWNTPAFVHLWMMYASASYFTKGNREEEPPIYQYAYCNMRPEVDLPNELVAVLLNEHEPKLPRLEVFYEGKPPNGAVQKQFGASFQSSRDLYTNALYEASDYKTAGRLQLPGKIRFQYFLSKTDGRNPNGKSVLYSCEAEVDSIDDRCPVELTTITLPAHYVANDLRVSAAAVSNMIASTHGANKRSSSFTYNGTDFSKIPTLKDLNKFTVTGGSVGLVNEHKRMVRIILGISTILPLTVLVLLAFKPKKNTAAKDRGNPE